MEGWGAVAKREALQRPVAVQDSFPPFHYCHSIPSFCCTKSALRIKQVLRLLSKASREQIFLLFFFFFVCSLKFWSQSYLACLYWLGLCNWEVFQKNKKKTQKSSCPSRRNRPRKTRIMHHLTVSCWNNCKLICSCSFLTGLCVPGHSSVDTISMYSKSNFLIY